MIVCIFPLLLYLSILCNLLIKPFYFIPLAHRNGNVGVLYLIETDEDIENITNSPPPMPFVAALPISFFNM